MKQDFVNKTACQIAEEIKNGQTTKEQVHSFFQERIERYQPVINSFVNVYNEFKTVAGQSKLANVPVAVKDNICIAKEKITCASRMLSDFYSPYDAKVIEKIKAAGLSLAGTTNMDEFAFGSSTENSCYGPCRNPWDLESVPGGSSGGSAAAVAARLVPLALGSDTAGSIRQPAALCGVVGIKPTYGRVSRQGLVAFGSSLDQIGPIATNIFDAACLLEIISGYDENDSTSSENSFSGILEGLNQSVSGLKVGIPKEYFGDGLDSEVRDSILEAISFFKKNKIKFTEVSLPHTEYAVATYYVISSSEASSNLQRFDGIGYGRRVAAEDINQTYTKSRSEGFGPETKRRILLGTYSLSSGYYDFYYLRALKVRRLIKNDFSKVFKEVDLLLTPTSPTPAFKIGEKIQNPVQMYLSDVYTISANLAGVPAVSLPCGFSKGGLPIGMQFIGKEFDEKTLIKLASFFQENTDFHKRIPKL